MKKCLNLLLIFVLFLVYLLIFSRCNNAETNNTHVTQQKAQTYKITSSNDYEHFLSMGYTYNNKSKSLVKNFVNSDPMDISTVSIQFNNNTNVKTILFLNSKNELIPYYIAKKEIQYDSNNRLKRIDFYNNNDQPCSNLKGCFSYYIKYKNYVKNEKIMYSNLYFIKPDDKYYAIQCMDRNNEMISSKFDESEDVQITGDDFESIEQFEETDENDNSVESEFKVDLTLKKFNVFDLEILPYLSSISKYLKSNNRNYDISYSFIDLNEDEQNELIITDYPNNSIIGPKYDIFNITDKNILNYIGSVPNFILSVATYNDYNILVAGYSYFPYRKDLYLFNGKKYSNYYSEYYQNDVGINISKYECDLSYWE